jgi:hypothetical protein
MRQPQTSKTKYILIHTAIYIKSSFSTLCTVRNPQIKETPNNKTGRTVFPLKDKSPMVPFITENNKNEYDSGSSFSPNKMISPEVGFYWLVIIFITVVFPAPFGPRKP